MFLRNKRVITVFLLCHALLAAPLLTSQLRPGTAAPEPVSSSLLSQRPSSYLADTDDNLVTIIADNQEKIGDTYKLSGNVEIQFRDFVVRGDEISWDTKTGEVTAQGHLSVDGGQHD